MAQQLIINVSSPKIMTALRSVLNAMDGVTIERVVRTKKSATEEILSNPDAMASIKRGEEDLQEGRTTTMSAKEVRDFLGV